MRNPNMNRHSLRLALFPMLVGTAVGALGCSSANSNNLNQRTAQAPTRNGAVLARDRNGMMLPGTAVRPVTTEQPTSLPPVGAQAQPTMVVSETMPGGQTGLSDGQSVPLTDASMSPGAVVQTVDSTAFQDINRKAQGAEDSFHNRQIPAPRRSFVDITAQPWFHHASDYHWLAGQLRYSKSENCWRLRYASLDESDPHGGEVTLIDYPALEYLKDGQYVRVNGQLVDAAKRDCCYKVASMEPVQKSADVIAGGEGSEPTKPTSISH